VTLTGDSARLYEILHEAASKSVKPGQITRAILETGLVHHILMLRAVGAIPKKHRAEAQEAIESISSRTIMRDLFTYAQEYWENQSGTGTIIPGE